MLATRTISWIAAIWVLVLGSYALAPFVLHGQQALTSFADIAQCLVPLLANAGLVMNAGTPHWRRNVFWMLFAMGCTLWMIGQFQWTYYEAYLHQELPDLYPGDVTFFLRGIPVMAALALRPQDRKSTRLNSSHSQISYAVFCLKKKIETRTRPACVRTLTRTRSSQLHGSCDHPMS